MSELYVRDDGSFAFTADVEAGMVITPIDAAQVIAVSPAHLSNIAKKLKTHDAKFDTVKQELVYKRRAKK